MPDGLDIKLRLQNNKGADRKKNKYQKQKKNTINFYDSNVAQK